VLPWSGRERARRNGRQHSQERRAGGRRRRRTDERANRRRGTKTTIDGIDHPTRVQQTGHSEQSWRTVMTLSGIVKIGVGSGFTEQPPRWLGKGKWRRQTDGCESRVRQRCVRSGNVLSKCCRWDYFGGVLHRTRERQGSVASTLTPGLCVFPLTATALEPPPHE
jgi:hypothetical protein